MFKQGDKFKVTAHTAPFATYTGVVDLIEDDGLYPIVATVTYMDSSYPVSYREHEITLLSEIESTAEIPVVVV